MDKRSIEQKINLILENAHVERSDNYLITKNKQNYINRSQDITIEVEESPSDFEFKNKQVWLLRKLYTNLNISEKENFREILLKKTIGTSDIVGVTAFNALIHINLFDESFNLIKSYYKSYNDNLIIEQLKLLSIILKNEWNIFSISQIQSIYDWINDALDGKNDIGRGCRAYPTLYKSHIPVWGKLFRQSNAILIKDLGVRLEGGIDLEINLDQKALTKEFKRFGFAEDLEITLEKIDKKLMVAEDGFDYKNCMDLIRSFTERFYEQIANSLQIKDWRKGDERDSLKVAKHFKKVELISEDQANMLTSIRHFLSIKGSHRLKSQHEDARLSRNMTIEFSLYLIRRLENKKSQK